MSSKLTYADLQEGKTYYGGRQNRKRKIKSKYNLGMSTYLTCVNVKSDGSEGKEQEVWAGTFIDWAKGVVEDEV